MLTWRQTIQHIDDTFFSLVRDKDCTKELYTTNYDKPIDDSLKKIAFKYAQDKEFLRLSPCKEDTQSKKKYNFVLYILHIYYYHVVIYRNIRHKYSAEMAIQQGILSNKTSKAKNVATLPDVSQENLVGSQTTRPSNVNTLDFPKEKVDVSPCHDVGKLANETETPTTSDSSSVSPKSDTPESDKNIKGVFRMKTISIRRAKDPRSFKCSECNKRTNTLQELNAHYIANHRKVKCDICDKSFNTPGALRKHRYTHVEEKSQYRCRTCSKIFPFESQLKSHRHVHHRNRNYICASANCGKSFKHPGDLAAHAKSHGEQHKCAHCNYSHSDKRNCLHCTKPKERIKRIIIIIIIILAKIIGLLYWPLIYIIKIILLCMCINYLY